MTDIAESSTVCLLPGYDPWLLGPGTNDAHVVPPVHRAEFSRSGNPVITGGVVTGSWARRRDEVEITWFADAGDPPTELLAGQVRRLARLLDAPLTLTLRTG